MIDPAAGAILISDPFLRDPHFMRTVVFLCEHTGQGSFGFVLNRPFEQTLDEFVPDLEGYMLPVYYGGPVQPDTLHFLHRLPHLIPGGQKVVNGVYWGGDFEKVIEL
ncbi:MAG TPA: YqgE/AlgH family protein, partial [Phnomibacter sp.]|nr:YqgE/AlgH family protein [Phnomibacter sp.]